MIPGLVTTFSWSDQNHGQSFGYSVRTCTIRMVFIAATEHYTEYTETEHEWVYRLPTLRENYTDRLSEELLLNPSLQEMHLTTTFERFCELLIIIISNIFVVH